MDLQQTNVRLIFSCNVWLIQDIWYQLFTLNGWCSSIKCPLEVLIGWEHKSSTPPGLFLGIWNLGGIDKCLGRGGVNISIYIKKQSKTKNPRRCGGGGVISQLGGGLYPPPPGGVQCRIASISCLIWFISLDIPHRRSLIPVVILQITFLLQQRVLRSDFPTICKCLQ